MPYSACRSQKWRFISEKSVSASTVSGKCRVILFRGTLLVGALLGCRIAPVHPWRLCLKTPGAETRTCYNAWFRYYSSLNAEMGHTVPACTLYFLCFNYHILCPFFIFLLMFLYCKWLQVLLLKPNMLLSVGVIWCADWKAPLENMSFWVTNKIHVNIFFFCQYFPEMFNTDITLTIASKAH